MPVPIAFVITVAPLISTVSSLFPVIAVIVTVPPVSIVKLAPSSKATPPPVNVKV